MDLMKNFIEEIVDEIKKEDKQIKEFKQYLFNSLVYNKIFVALYCINIATFLFIILILIILVKK